MKLCHTFATLLNNGVEIAIISSTPYQALIPHVLENIGLTKGECAKIHIIPPKKGRIFTSIKTLEEKVREAAGGEINPEEVVIVSHPQHILRQAQTAGYKTVFAELNGEGNVGYLNTLRQMAELNPLANPVGDAQAAAAAAETERRNAARRRPKDTQETDPGAAPPIAPSSEKSFVRGSRTQRVQRSGEGLTPILHSGETPKGPYRGSW